jgi:hypothetical protein
MLKPKASHLVERVAEKLLQSGSLEESAAHLLDPDQPVVSRPEPVPAQIARPPARPARPNRSALFAPRPDEAATTIASPRPAATRQVDPGEYTESNVVPARPRRPQAPEMTLRPMAPSVLAAEALGANDAVQPRHPAGP